MALDNTVTVNIFLSGYGGITSVGHVQLITHRGGEDGTGYNMDHLPTKADVAALPTSRWGRFWRGVEEIVAGKKSVADNTPPHATIQLNNIDVDAINAAWQAFKEQGLYWGVADGCSTEEGHWKTNSTSLCLALLIAGGLGRGIYAEIGEYGVFRRVREALMDAAALSTHFPLRAIMEFMGAARAAGKTLESTTGVFVTTPVQVLDIIRQAEAAEQRHAPGVAVAGGGGVGIAPRA